MASQAATNDDLTALRRRAMAVLADTATADIETQMAALTVPAHEELRTPENGLVMLRGRVGGDGAPFNLGEATVTRAAVRLVSGETGFAYVLGRDARKARLIAICDAMLQSSECGTGSRCGDRSARTRHARAQAGDRRRDRSNAGELLHAGERRGLADATDSQRTRHRQRRVRGAIDLSQGDGRDGAPRLGPDGRLDRRSAGAVVASRGCAIALTLFDHDTPIWLGAPFATDAVASWLRFNTGCPIVADQGQSAFALVGDSAALPPLETFALGTPDYPDRSTTRDPAGREPHGGRHVVPERPGHSRHGNAARRQGCRRISSSS